MIPNGPFVVGKWVSLTECTWHLLGLLRACVLHGHARQGRIACGFLVWLLLGCVWNCVHSYSSLVLIFISQFLINVPKIINLSGGKISCGYGFQ